MRFFTPELYLRFNSSDEEEADQANEEWEAALSEYRKHLGRIRNRLPSPVKQLTKSGFHDAELLACDQWPAGAIVAVQQDGQVTLLIYDLWDHIQEVPSPEGWPFSKVRTHWLYDEVDVAPGKGRRFWHRVLLSDGRILAIPFDNVFVRSLSLSSPAEGVRVRQSV